MTGTLFTIGYSGRTIDDFIALLKQHKITALCDVRSMPYSNRNPQFNRESLKMVLKSHSIDYAFLGEELGARPKDPSCYVDGKAIYQKIAASPLFTAGLERIEVGVQKGYILTLMCAEKDPLTCHRSILICKNLRGRMIDIHHIIDREITETQTDLEKRLIAQLKLYPDLFKHTDTNGLIERAYEIQGDRIAYVEKGRTEQLAEMVSEEHERY
ncbi:MAG TPA: hypothetical protein DHV16_10895 [Nitrospiraceae bacterium]|nr:MAG: hypothetical protein A2Z82_07780 [Nitrospirae bacterium GWA2_46_11]HAK88303.1 hypothetical protein [Nitrospiraceae bacterium]HCZ12731.1 hypothetical protein [Nitrospiraceae bacterium]